MQKDANRQNENAALIIAIILTVIWIVVIGIIFYFYPESAQRMSYDQSLTALVAVGLFLPLILIWIAALLSKSLAAMRDEAKALRKSVERMKTTLDVTLVEETETRDRWIQSQLMQISTQTKRTNKNVAELTAKALEYRGDTPPPRNTIALSKKSKVILTDGAQADLPLQGDKNIPDAPITIRELIKAMNFPDNTKDTEGFRVLRRAMDDPNTSKLLQSSQDVLTMLSEDGIFMDDLRINTPEASAWRRFANGARGKDIAALGMVRDRTALALANTRLKNDSLFREKVHSFLTQFDTILAEFEETAKDNEIFELGKTRSALAFMLLGRLSGAFDAR